MLLFFTAFISIFMGCFVGIAGQERRAKIWFLLLCASTAVLCIGLWVEVNVPNSGSLGSPRKHDKRIDDSGNGTPVRTRNVWMAT